MCAIMSSTEDPPENALDAFARWFADDYLKDLDCLLPDTLSSSKQIEWDSPSIVNGNRQATWIGCTQLGQWVIVNEGIGQPFGRRFDAVLIQERCAQIFSNELLTLDFIAASISRSETFFGGLNPSVERVFFTHGELDPGKHKGPLEDLNRNAPVVVMPRQSAGRDFGSPAVTDDDDLLETKARARNLILQWISD